MFPVMFSGGSVEIPDDNIKWTKSTSNNQTKPFHYLYISYVSAAQQQQTHWRNDVERLAWTDFRTPHAAQTLSACLQTVL